MRLTDGRASKLQALVRMVPSQTARLYGKPVAFFLGEETDPVLEADEVSAALFRATRQLSDLDRQQVLQFAEFLRHSGPAPRGTS